VAKNTTVSSGKTLSASAAREKRGEGKEKRGRKTPARNGINEREGVLNMSSSAERRNAGQEKRGRGTLSVLEGGGSRRTVRRGRKGDLIADSGEHSTNRKGSGRKKRERRKGYLNGNGL